jgi:23S rRNA (adenine2503-C2)-methyltransferase
LSRHYFARLADDPEQMTDLPAGQRAELVEGLLPKVLTEVRTQEADRGKTRKTLWRLFDGALVESVLMRYPDRVTMCVSSQAGCGMACTFCATGQGGLQRNMSTAEIIEQVVAGARALARNEVAGGPGRVSNIVFMGMGEPLANYKAVLGAVRRMTDPSPDGLGMSARGITVSTVGLVPRIMELAGEGIPVTLALSLHAPDDELRAELVPVNTRWSVAEALDAAWHYASVTKRRVSIEYAMMRDINDQGWRADLLADLLNARGNWGWAHVNLIPLNEVPGSRFTRSRDEDTAEFVRRLEARGISTTVRDTRGSDIDAACGQLAALED